MYFIRQDTTGGVFEGSWISTLLRENSREFQEVPQETCEDCLYEMKDWEEQQEILKKTNSLHEGELKTLNRPCSSLQSEQEYLNEEENMDELCEDNIRHKEDQHELIPRQSDENIEQTDQCTSYTSIVPQMFLSGA
jgi:predicted RNase H-like nuclease (RuvC/YqgF family)